MIFLFVVQAAGEKNLRHGQQQTLQMFGIEDSEAKVPYATYVKAYKKYVALKDREETPPGFSGWPGAVKTPDDFGADWKKAGKKGKPQPAKKAVIAQLTKATAGLETKFKEYAAATCKVIAEAYHKWWVATPKERPGLGKYMVKASYEAFRASEYGKDLGLPAFAHMDDIEDLKAALKDNPDPDSGGGAAGSKPPAVSPKAQQIFDLAKAAWRIYKERPDKVNRGAYIPTKGVDAGLAKGGTHLCWPSDVKQGGTAPASVYKELRALCDYETKHNPSGKWFFTDSSSSEGVSLHRETDKFNPRGKYKSFIFHLSPAA